MLVELIPLSMFGVICVLLMLGYPVAFTLGGVALIFAGLGWLEVFLILTC